MTRVAIVGRGRVGGALAANLAAGEFDVVNPVGRDTDVTHIAVQTDIVLLAVTDAAVIGYRASGVLFVAAADATSRHAAQTAIEQLEHARVRFIGAVLNRVDLQGNAYYYSKYYRKEYQGYYTASTTT